MSEGLSTSSCAQGSAAELPKATGRFPAKKLKIDGLGGCPMSLSLAQKQAMFPSCNIQTVTRTTFGAGACPCQCPGLSTGGAAWPLRRSPCSTQPGAWAMHGPCICTHPLAANRGPATADSATGVTLALQHHYLKELSKLAHTKFGLPTHKVHWQQRCQDHLHRATGMVQPQPQKRLPWPQLASCSSVQPWRSTVGGASFAYMRSLACRGGETLLACLLFCCYVKVLLL
ncbi:hypothetical protein COO60DRAFT_1202601 [Scenedesmus sp. NREL 46B-D3]|nr:hypothetical protein COO60DRAFT_1202601 [Scenedesmus sp. NREL 46B-D3]